MTPIFELDVPFAARGDLFIASKRGRPPAGFEAVSVVEANFLARDLGDAGTWLASRLADFVDPLRLYRLRREVPSLDVVAPPLELAEAGANETTSDEAMHWIEIRLLDETHAPMPSEKISLQRPDDVLVSGTTGNAGRYFLDGLHRGGMCRVDFPDLIESLPSTLSLSTDRIHTIIVEGLWFVHMRILDFHMRPVSDSACTLRLPRVFTGTTDAEGMVSFRLGAGANEADGLLAVDTDALGHRGPRPLLISPLAPASDPYGQRIRLDNLGYVPVDAEPDDPPSPYAVEEFQCDHDLPVTGVCDGATQAKLVEVHGH
jgi:hypothetical protein